MNLNFYEHFEADCKSFNNETEKSVTYEALTLKDLEQKIKYQGWNANTANIHYYGVTHDGKRNLIMLS